MIIRRSTRLLLLVLAPVVLPVTPLSAAGRQTVCGNPFRALWICVSALAIGVAQWGGTAALAGPDAEGWLQANPDAASVGASLSSISLVAEDLPITLADAAPLAPDPSGSMCPLSTSTGAEELAKVIRFYTDAAGILFRGWGQDPLRPAAIAEELRSARDRFFADNALDAPEWPGSSREAKLAAYNHVGAVLERFAALVEDRQAALTCQEAVTGVMARASQVAVAWTTGMRADPPSPIRRHLGAAQFVRNR